MNKSILLISSLLIIYLVSCNQKQNNIQPSTAEMITYPRLNNITVQGLMGEALSSSKEGRLKHFIKDKNSKPIAIFSFEARKSKTKSGWKGEHAGKWLYAASKAAYRSSDKTLKQNIQDVAAYLISTQEEDGYLGTNAPSIRMTTDSSLNIKSWDVWIHTYMISGLLEANAYFPNDKYVHTAKKIGDLMIKTFMEDGKSLAHNSFHHGMVGTGSLDAFVELYNTTNNEKYLDFAQYCVDQMKYRKGLDLVNRSLKGYDLANIGNGKIYEMLRNYVGLAKLYQVTNNKDYLEACIHAWHNIKAKHLTPTGGPWGGVEQHKECFNLGYMFSPYGLVETCSTMDWIRLNKQLFKITGEAKYVEEIEKSAYNALLGAKFPDGHGWIYYSYTNGQRQKTSKWACCSSSGTVALEELPPLICTKKNKGIAINLYTPSQVMMQLNEAGNTTITQESKYPFCGKIKISIKTSHPGTFPVYIRIPEWTDDQDISIDGKALESSINPGSYLKISREWHQQTINIHYHMKIRTLKQTNEYNHKGWYIDSTQQFISFMRGPLVYAAAIKDTRDEPSKYCIKDPNPVQFIKKKDNNKGTNTLILNMPGEKKQTLWPYYLAGNREDGTYCKTWFILLNKQ